MIEIKNVSKTFGSDKKVINALSEVTANMEEGHVFGLIGTNGAGKSTMLRCICGVYLPDEGSVFIDGEPVYENPSAKAKLFYISDDQYFASGSTPKDMLNYYLTMYPNFDKERFFKLMGILQLDPGRKINTFSKGMKKQLSVLYGVCSGCKYLLCDETFDGLDPVIRQAIKKLFIKEMEENHLTPIIASHNLRELEDICDHIGLLHKGGILFSRDLDDMKLGMFKIQAAFRQVTDVKLVEEKFPIVSKEQRGSLFTLTLRGSKEDIEAFISSLDPIFFEIIPLTLEEIFINETEVLGYEFNSLTE